MNTPLYCRLFRLRAAFVRFVQYLLSAADNGSECIGCGKKCGPVPVCSECLHRLFSFPGYRDGRCRICGKILLSAEETCLSCRAAPVLNHTDGVFPLQPYRLWIQNLVWLWKLQNCRTVTPLFARLLRKGLLDLSAAAGVPDQLPIVPVPPRPGKIRKNGWDQIDDLCSYLHGCWGYTILPLLERISDNPQKKLNRAQRLETVGKSYVLRSASYTGRVLQKRTNGIPPAVVLLDDVMTTGATIESCAALLKQAGIGTVYAITLFVVD
ncbi:MAG: hypothetical protein LKF96_07325 [Treponema sp.]|nr:hypothetical protein [Treponema sp.]